MPYGPVSTSAADEGLDKQPNPLAATNQTPQAVFGLRDKLPKRGNKMFVA
jgi:hypothetical protein